MNYIIISSGWLPVVPVLCWTHIAVGGELGWTLSHEGGGVRMDHES